MTGYMDSLTVVKTGMDILAIATQLGIRDTRTSNHHLSHVRLQIFGEDNTGEAIAHSRKSCGLALGLV